MIFESKATRFVSSPSQTAVRTMRSALRRSESVAWAAASLAILVAASGCAPVSEEETESDHTELVSGTTPSACNAASWSPRSQYPVGSTVTYGNGKVYVAKFANPGYDPTISTYYWAPYAANVPNWQRRTSYAAGAVVRYANGKVYVAKFANPGYDPTISTYYWAAAACAELAVEPAPAPPTPTPPTAPTATTGLTVAPYFESWSNGSLLAAKQDAGLNSATLAFAITRGSCVLDSGFLDKLPDARRFVAAGGQLRISFGGADGTYAEIACKSDDELLALVERVMTDSGTRRLDFDVEGEQLLDEEGTARRSRVLARVQSKYPDAFVSLTLPGWLHGLSETSTKLLRTTVAAGVRIDTVNVMTMDFGLENIRTMVSPPTVAQASIMTLAATVNQLRAVYPGKTTGQLYAMMGVTPMIGRNFDGATFTLEDARTLAAFVKSNGMGLLAYWSFQRDRAQAAGGETDLNAYSGVAQSAFQFHGIFDSARR